MMMPRGVSLDQLEKSGERPPGFDKTFSKKTNRVNKVFIIVGILVAVVIIGLLVFLFGKVNPGQ